ncbi:hypothetical protein AV691_004252 [Salmonella enterica subsp. enterica serovar 4,[5],12:i:-]|nr:hypothetical protein [Salmonella enterica subsp. enterica serovar 4,[5],12:i:-]
MALYRTGTAAMDAQGVITGTGTKWREPLSLIRTGATIVFLTSPLKLAVISDIVSDTEMKAIQTDGEPVENGNYVILLNDSLTVDGMAQDVAETLRYYQSKETVIEEAIEFFKNFDLKTLQDLVARAEASAQKTDADRAATEQLKNDTQTIKDAAVTETQQIKDSAVSETQQIKNSAVAETNQIKADTDAIKNQTQQIKDSAVTEITGIKNEALDARDEAENAQFAAEQSKVGADNAKAGAETARDEARQWAQQVQPENLLHKDQNLNDLADKVEARKVLQVQAVISNDPASHSTPGDYNAFTNPQASYELRIANNGEWRVARNDNNSTSALAIGAGGTGASDVYGARRNLGLSSFENTSLDAYMRNPANLNQFIYMNNTGRWGAYDSITQQEIALGVAQGGTGATNISQARNNFGIGETDIPVFRGVHLIEKNGGNSGLVYLTNRDASGNDVSNSRIYNEIQGGLSKTTIHTFRPGGGNSYLQIDERGYLSNIASLAVGMSNHALGANAIAIGDSDSGLRWSSDGVIQAVSDGQNIIAWTPTQLMAYKPITSYTPENTRFAYVEGTRTGAGSYFIGGKLQAGSFSAWRDRATGVLCEIPAHDAAISIFKAAHWGYDWITGLDCVNWSAGGAETHLYVKGGEFIFNNVGNATCNQWISTSDIRMKAHLKEIETASDKIDYLTGYTYYKRNNLIEDENSVYSIEAGLIAQDVERVLPEAVHSLNNDGQLDPKGEAIKGINYNGVVALLVNAFKEQKAKIDKQQEEINTLRNELDELKNLVKSMLNGNSSTIPELP